MTKYKVTGMSCAACQARVEKAVSSLEGVDSCAVSLLTNSMGVEGSAEPSEIIKAVENAGYGASLADGADQGGAVAAPNYDDALKDTETPKIRKRLIASLILLVPLMYVSMGHMMWGWPVPAILHENHVAIGIYEMLLAGLVMVINQKFFINGFRGLIHLAPNMDTLVAMGSAASYIYSVCVLFAMTAGKGHAHPDFYFESAAMILALITVGKLLESISKGRTTDALKELMKLSAKTAVVLKDGAEVEVPIEQVRVGDKFVVKPGQNIPVDGIVVEGNGAVNEAALTGESIPVDKAKGDPVSAATLNENGYLICEATRVGKDTTLSQIIQMVSDAAATKAPIAKIADKVSGVFVPVVIAIAVITFIIWMVAGQEIGFSLARAISVLVISCPCALGLATPVAIMVGNGMGAKNGIMFKTAESLEETGRVQIIALDKTGTITGGAPEVTDVFPCKGISKEEVLDVAAAVESRSTHPLAKAISAYIGSTTMRISDYEEVPGGGVKAFTWEGSRAVSLAGGNAAFMKENNVPEADIDRLSRETAEFGNAGKTTVMFEKGGKLLGLIALADSVREDSKDAIAELRAMGIKTVMLTGDRRKTAEAIAAEVGVDEVVAEVLPDGKEEVVRKLMEHGKVAMVGDGINDAPALTRANIGIAIGAGTDVAIDAADVVLMKNSLKDVAAAVRLSRATLRNIHQNLFWAFFYNVIGIPLAAGAYIHAFGWTLNPMIGAAAMSLSSFCVVTNALRLNLFDMYKTDKDKPAKRALGDELLLKDNNSNNHADNETDDTKEENVMEITVKGMMCPHCEARVKAAMEKLDGVASAAADHDHDLVTLELSAEVAESAIKAAVEEAGYEFGGIREC